MSEQRPLMRILAKGVPTSVVVPVPTPEEHARAMALWDAWKAENARARAARETVPAASRKGECLGHPDDDYSIAAGLPMGQTHLLRW